MIGKINKIFHTPNWLFVLLAAVLILRIPSFFEPYSYGDELIYLALGEGIRQGIPLYSGIHDNKPPLLYITAAIAGNLFWFKAILAFWHIITVFIFWKLSEVLFPKKEKTQIVATSIFALLTTIPLLEGNIVNAELFMIGPTILAFYILLTKKLTSKNLLLSGFLLSISALFKIPAAFDIPAIVIYWLIIQNKLDIRSLLKVAKRAFIILIGFAIPIGLTFIWFYLSGSFKEYLVAAFLQNFGYLSSWRPDDVQKPFLEKNGPLLMRAGIVALASLILYLKRKRLSKEFMFATIWLFLSLFAVTLSERPYPHYLIQSVAPIAILAAILFTSAKIEQVYTMIPLFFAAFIPFYFHFYHYETFSYYNRFIKLASGQITKQNYLNTFGSQVPRNYEVAKFVVSSTDKKDKIFVWGDGVPIYALSDRLPPGKYVADYHIKDFSSNSETLEVIKKNMPELIIILPDSNPFIELDYFIKKNYGLSENIDGAQIWKLLSTSMRAIFSY